MVNIAIIGGGAAGLFSALLLKDKNVNITIYEKLNILGKKLSQTGNGKGNLSNLNISSSYYNQNIDSVLNSFTPNDLIKLLEEYNIYTKSDSEGRIYPLTSAKDFTEMLINLIKDKVRIINEEVIEIKDKNVFTKNSFKNYDYIILAVGSKSQVKGFTMVKTDLKYKGYKPGLLPINVDNKYIKGLSGIRIKSRAKLYLNNEFIHEEIGELQFKDTSISGIMILQLSSYLARKKSNNSFIMLDLLPDKDINIVKKELKDIKNRNLLYTVTDCLKCYLNPKITLRLLENNNLRNIMNELDTNLFAEIIKGYKIYISENDDFNQSQVSVGGILLSEVNLDTFESKQKGLYVIGEALDVDGLSGGYNLHFAFASAFLAVRNIGGLIC